jgi:hypothetical protein
MVNHTFPMDLGTIYQLSFMAIHPRLSLALKPRRRPFQIQASSTLEGQQYFAFPSQTEAPKNHKTQGIKRLQ